MASPSLLKVPELPEVETVRRGLEPHLAGEIIRDVVIRCHALRYPIEADLPNLLRGRRILAIHRRAKYLLIELDHGHIILHLGMSGSLRIVDLSSPPGKHDHVDIQFQKRKLLRFHDPRRFGALLWTEKSLTNHSLLKHLGPEPLGKEFNVAWLHAKAAGRRVAIKPFLMDAKIVVGVGNIYAAESLWRAGIHPKRAAGRVSHKRLEVLVEKIREVLLEAIAQGGTTLKDHKTVDGDLGYFAQDLAVYGRAGEPCIDCGSSIKKAVLGQRGTYWCPSCQK